MSEIPPINSQLPPGKQCFGTPESRHTPGGVRPFGARVPPVAVPTCADVSISYAVDTRVTLSATWLGARNWVGPIGPEIGGPAGVVLVALWLNGAAGGWVGGAVSAKLPVKKGGGGGAKLKFYAYPLFPKETFFYCCR